MMRSRVLWSIVVSCALSVRTDQPNVQTRPITEADSVLAVYPEDWGNRPGAGGTKVILVAWPDGHIVWSTDRIQGGGPYRAGRIDPKKFATLLKRFEKDGLFADEKLNQANFGPDSQFITVHIKSGKKQVKMQSWHELYEMSDEVVVNDRGIVGLQGRRRLDELRKAPADYLFFRMVWSETRSKLSDLLPSEWSPSGGEPITNAGVLSWHEPTAAPKPNRPDSPSKK
jgi:hypothetical protein